MLRLLLPLAAVLSLVLLAPRAHAEKGELAWSVGAGNLTLVSRDAPGTVTRQAPLVHGGARYALTDFIQLGGLLRAGVGVGAGQRAEPVGQALVEVRYVLDALTWVPYLGVGGGALFRGDGPAAYDGGSGPSWDATLHGAFGVDWRPQRRWSLGAVFRYHVSLTDLPNAVGPIDLAFTFTLYRD